MKLYMDLCFEKISELTEETSPLILYLTKLFIFHDTIGSEDYICLFHRDNVFVNCKIGFWLVNWTEKTENAATDESGTCKATK